ncbi:MAG TPA: hypothetical protein VN626_03730, partial [Clostridia bacterium]|nr:hypothetical protein [Clostridia bacterium]
STDTSSDDDTAVIYDNDTQTNYNPGTGGFGFDDIAYGTQIQAQVPAVANNIVSAGPAVISSASTPSSAVGQPDSSEASKKEDKQSEEDSPAIIGTTKKAENKLTAPAATSPTTNSNTAADSIDYRKLAMIACSIGAILAVIGLMVCALVSFNRSRERFY